MDFVIQWSCYLLAFLGGSAVAWVVVTLSIKRASHQCTCSITVRLSRLHWAPPQHPHHGWRAWRSRSGWC